MDRSATRAATRATTWDTVRWELHNLAAMWCCGSPTRSNRQWWIRRQVKSKTSRGRQVSSVIDPKRTWTARRESIDLGNGKAAELGKHLFYDSLFLRCLFFSIRHLCHISE